MSLWTLIKLLAAFVVIGVMTFTGMLAYHVAVAPLGGVFATLIPDPSRVLDDQSDAELTKLLESPEMPNIDPGEKSFQKAHDLLAMGRLTEAREKLTSIIHIYPSSPSAPIARRIVGEMNLDEILSATHMEGKQLHVVKRGDSFLGIASKYQTSMDCIMHLNAMTEVRGLQPGDEVLVMPLDFRLLIEPRRKSVSIWNGGRFIREYPALHFNAVPSAPQQGTITSRIAEIDGRKIAPQSKEYRSANKVIQISKPNVQIRGWDGGDEVPPGILLRPHDMEEINLLTRVGNEVEVR